MLACHCISIVSCRKDYSWSLMESFSVLMSSCDDEDDDNDDNDGDEDKDDDDNIELLLERKEYSTEEEDEDKESIILSTNVDSPSNSLVIELWSCHCSSIVLHLQSDIFCVDGGRCDCCHT